MATEIVQTDLPQANRSEVLPKTPLSEDELLPSRELIVLPDNISPYEILDDPDMRGKRRESVPVSLLLLDSEIVDTSHVLGLKNSMCGSGDGRGDRIGQISPATLCARYATDEDIEQLEEFWGVALDRSTKIIVYHILDGFHRGTGLALEQIATGKQQEIDSTVVYNITHDEMYDLRILAANSVKTTRFARIGHWMTKSFERTSWFQSGYTLTQIFSLANNDSSGRNLGLSPEEAQEAKQWALNKAHMWNADLGTIAQQLRVIEDAAPELVKKVRITGGGYSGHGPLNPARLTAIVSHLPKDRDTQVLVANAVQEHNLKRDQVEALSYAASQVKGDNFLTDFVLQNPLRTIYLVNILRSHDTPVSFTTLATVVQYSDIGNGDVEKLVGLLARYKDKPEITDLILDNPLDALNGADSLDFESDQPREETSLEDFAVDELDSSDNEGPESVIYSSKYSDHSHAYDIPRTREVLEAENKQLRAALEEAQKTRVGSFSAEDLLWWRTFADLSPHERGIIGAILDEGWNIEDVAMYLKWTENQVMQHFISGFRKLMLYIKTLEENELDKLIARETQNSSSSKIPD